MSLGSKERWYFGFAVFATSLGAILAKWAPGTLLGFAAVLSPICTGLYGGALGKLWVESRSVNGSKPV